MTKAVRNSLLSNFISDNYYDYLSTAISGDDALQKESMETMGVNQLKKLSVEKTRKSLALQEISENTNFPSTVRRKLSLRSDDEFYRLSGPGSSVYSNQRMSGVSQLRISIPHDSQQSNECRPVLQTPIDTPSAMSHIATMAALSCSPVKKSMRESSISFKAPSFHLTPYCGTIIDQGSAQISAQKCIPARAISSFKAPPLNLLDPAEINDLFDKKSLDIFGDSTSSSPFDSISLKISLEPTNDHNYSSLNQAASFSSIQNLLSGYSSYKRLHSLREGRPQSARKSESKDAFDRLSYSSGRDLCNLVFPPFEMGSMLSDFNVSNGKQLNVDAISGTSAVCDGSTYCDLSSDQIDELLGTDSVVEIEREIDRTESKKRRMKVMNEVATKRQMGRRSARLQL